MLKSLKASCCEHSVVIATMAAVRLQTTARLSFVTGCVILSLLTSPILAIGEDDRITLLPNVTFKINFNQYSGYLNANENGTLKMFYWLVESQSETPENDPLVVWFTGGPGCSSVGGLFEELGPFYVNQDGLSLYENIYAWNKRANVIAIESPIGVGFSYDTDNITGYTVGDDLTAQLNHDAIADFFARVQTRYQNRTWYITGESYAGIYIPTVTQRILESIVAGSYPNSNFKGVAIGNGYMNVPVLYDSLVYWSYYHGLIGIDQWTEILAVCGCNTVNLLEDCKFSQHIDFNTYNGTNDCGDLTNEYIPNQESYYDSYNFYQSCYGTNATNTFKSKSTTQHQLLKNYRKERLLRPAVRAAYTGGLQTANSLNYNSTDSQFGYPCWNEDGVEIYLNNEAVQNAFHIDQTWILSETVWEDCSDPIGYNYPTTYWNTNTQFDKIISIATMPNTPVPGFHVLVYNGDVDTVCNFLGDAWHIDNITKTWGFQKEDRTTWNFRERLAGYYQNYYTNVNGTNDKFYIDVLTVKGSGHFVPNDRPGPALQMLVNFLNGEHDYNKFEPALQLPTPAATVTIGGASHAASFSLVTFFAFVLTTLFLAM